MISSVSSKQNNVLQLKQKEQDSKISYSSYDKDRTFDSHANRSNLYGIKGTANESGNPNINRINDGPIQLASGPFDHKFLYDKKVKSSALLPPHRPWENEHHQPSNSINYNFKLSPQNFNNSGPGPRVLDNLARQSGTHFRRRPPQRPDKIVNKSYQVSSADGDENITVRPSFHDDVQVFHSVDHQNKMKRLEFLEGKNTRKLASMEKKMAYRFVLTKCHPLMNEEDVELYLFKNFGSIKDLYVRKNEMKRHNDYSTFVFIVNSREGFDIDEVAQHDFPGNIMCFFTPNRYKRRQ